MYSAGRAGRAQLAALAALAVGGLFAAMSVWWAVGGTWLLDTVGGSLERAGRDRGIGILALLWGTAALKAVAAALPLAVAWPPRPRRVAWAVRRLVWLEAVVLSAYGLVYTVGGLLVQTGAITASDGADGRALRWHTYLWDPWFLLWGALVLGVLLLTRGHRADDQASGAPDRDAGRA